MRSTFMRRLAGTAAALTAGIAVALAAPAAQAAPRAAAGYTPPPGVIDPCPPASPGMAGCASLTSAPGSHAAVRPAAAVSKTATNATASTTCDTSTATPVGYSPSDLQSAYGLSPGTGYGATVAVVTAYDDPCAASDLAQYRSEYGLPACTTANGCFQQVSQTGSTTSLPGTSAGWTAPAAESIDMISAICPNCHILLVEANSTAISDFGTAENEAVTLGAKFIDNDWVISETQLGAEETSYDTEYFDHPGVAITAPAGDDGYGNIYYPAASPYVTAVGGTTLTADTSVPRGYTETAWTGTSSGCSAYEPKPSWQTDTGCANRTLNDIAADADPNTPVAYFDSPTEGGWGEGSGTTVAAAIVAAAYALAGTPANDGDPTSVLYSNASGLTDITSGSNGTCAVSYLCTAGPGYDGPTGLGTPYGTSAFLASYFHPMTLTRFLDTRNGTGGTTGPVAADGTVKLTVTGINGIPAANVTAVAVNVTALSGTTANDIQVYPDGTPEPVASNLNYTVGGDVANLAIVPVPPDGKIDLHNAGSGTVQLLADISGYFTSDPTASGDTTFTPMTPTRILDTRNGTGAPEEQLASQSVLAVQVGGTDGIPSGVSAVAVSVGVTNQTASGWVVFYPDGVSRPTPASNVQFASTGSIQGMAIVPVGTDGKIDIYNNSADGIDVFADVSGYFTLGTSGETYHAIAATRLIDTRKSTAVAAGGTLSVSQGTTATAPSPTLVLNVTAVDGTSSGFLIAYQAGTARPAPASTLDYPSSQAIADAALTPSGNGEIDVYNNSSGTVQVVVDCFGYFSTG
jgi:hypothetical protein